jgi:hypothetical protein
MNFADLLVSREAMFLTSIADAGHNRLEATICIGGHQRLPRAILGKHVDEIGKMPVEYTDAAYCELTWNSYFAFMVRDESFAAVRKEEKYVGHGVRIYETSWLLASVPLLSNGLHDSPELGLAPLSHFALCCANHIVDILARAQPVVRDLGRRPIQPKRPTASQTQGP